MKKILYFILLAMSMAAYAQKPPIKFGDVSIDELKMTRYVKDTSAAAVILMDYGQSNLNYKQNTGFIIDFDRIRRIKIFRKEGYEFANQSIPIYHTNKADEKLGSLKAVTYNLEGGKIVESKMKNDAVFKEKLDDNVDLIKLTLPNVKEGSVIEITYNVQSEFLFNFQDWEFQSTVPTQWSEYRVRIPEYFHYEKYMQGYIGLTTSEDKTEQRRIMLTVSGKGDNSSFGRSSSIESIDYNEQYSRLIAQNVPAFKEEPYMNNYQDYLSRINFELGYTQFPNQPVKNYMGTWESLNKEFLDEPSFGEAVKGSGFLSRTVEDITTGVTDAKEKIGKIYSYVKENVEWNGNSRKYVSDNFKSILESKKGNSADINLLLVNMFQKAGFYADPVLISTRSHGFVREQFPMSSQFNYVIASLRLDDKILLFDATDRSLPMGVMPERCLNGQGYAISPDHSGWIKLAPNFKSRTVTSVEMNLSAQGELAGKVSITRDGYDAQKMRKLYHSKGEENYLTDLSTSYHWELQKSAFENLQKLGEAVKEQHDVKIAESVQSGGDVMYLNPLIKDQITENPFKTETRQFPVDFGSPSEQLFMGKYNLPEGFVVEELPKPKVIVLPNNGGKYVYNVSGIGNTLQFTSQLSINRPLFTQEEYTALREFYNQIVTKQAEQIVIKKK